MLKVLYFMKYWQLSLAAFVLLQGGCVYLWHTGVIAWWVACIPTLIALVIIGLIGFLFWALRGGG